METYAQLAKALGVEPTDPRVNQIAQKAVKKGYNLGEYSDWIAKGAQGEPPKRTDYGAEGAPSFLARGAKPKPEVDNTKQWDSPNLTNVQAVIREKGIEAMKDGPGMTFLKHGVNSATLGAYGALDRKFGSGGTPEALEAQRRSDAESPIAAAGGEVAGMFVPGSAPLRVGKAAVKAVGAATRFGANAPAAVKVLLGAARGAAATEIANPVISGTRSLVDEVGTDAPVIDRLSRAWEASKNAATDPVALGVGATFGAAGGAADAIRGAKGQTGKDIRLVEKYRAEPSVRGGARGGAFDEPPLAGLDATHADIGTASDRAARELNSVIPDKFQVQTNRPFVKQIEAVDNSRAGSKPMNVAEIGSELRALASDAGTSPAARAQVEILLDDLLKKSKVVALRPVAKTAPTIQRANVPMGEMVESGTPDTIHGTPKVISEGNAATVNQGAATMTDIAPDIQIHMSARDLNKWRKVLSEASKAGATPGTKAPLEGKLESITKSVRDMLDDTPYGPLNKQYHADRTAYENSRAQVGLKKKPSSDPEVDINKLRLTVGRQGQDTEVAGSKSDKANRFRAGNPEFEPLLDTAALLRAKGRLKPQILGNKSGGLYGKLDGIVSRNVEPAVGTIAYPMARSMGEGAARGGMAAGSVRNAIMQALEQQRIDQFIQQQQMEQQQGQGR